MSVLRRTKNALEVIPCQYDLEGYAFAQSSIRYKARLSIGFHLLEICEMGLRFDRREAFSGFRSPATKTRRV